MAAMTSAAMENAIPARLSVTPVGGRFRELVGRPGQLLVEIRDLLALHDGEHDRDPEREVDADHEGRAQATGDDLPDLLAGQVARAHRRDGDDRHDDRQQQGQQPLPVREVARPDEEQRPVRVLRGEALGIAELGDRGALRLGGDDARGDLGLDGVRDERPDLRLEVGALGRGNGAQDAPDVAIGESAHDSRPPWPRRRTDGVDPVPVGEELRGETITVGADPVELAGPRFRACSTR